MAHASSANPILCSAMIQFKSDQNRPINICHIIVDGSYPWVLGRNINRLCEVLNVGANCLRFSPTGSEDSRDTMTLVDHQHHRYLQINRVDTSLKHVFRYYIWSYRNSMCCSTSDELGPNQTSCRQSTGT